MDVQSELVQQCQRNCAGGEVHAGHAGRELAILQLLEDVERRKAAAASVGLGFEVAESPCNFHYSALVEAADQPLTR